MLTQYVKHLLLTSQDTWAHAADLHATCGGLH